MLNNCILIFLLLFSIEYFLHQFVYYANNFLKCPSRLRLFSSQIKRIWSNYLAAQNPITRKNWKNQKKFYVAWQYCIYFLAFILFYLSKYLTNCKNCLRFSIFFDALSVIGHSYSCIFVGIKYCNKIQGSHEKSLDWITFLLILHLRSLDLSMCKTLDRIYFWGWNRWCWNVQLSLEKKSFCSKLPQAVEALLSGQLQ